jgi:hypothetical protein
MLQIPFKPRLCYISDVDCLLFHYDDDIVMRVTACRDLSSQYRSCWVSDLPIKRVKAEHVVMGIPLGLFIRGLGCSNLMLCIYADPSAECYCCAVAVLLTRTHKITLSSTNELLFPAFGLLIIIFCLSPVGSSFTRRCFIAVAFQLCFRVCH